MWSNWWTTLNWRVFSCMNKEGSIIQSCYATAKDPIEYSAISDHDKVKSWYISLFSSFPFCFSENWPPPIVKKWKHFSTFTSPYFRSPSIILYKCSIFWLQLRSNYDILSFSLLRIPPRYNRTIEKTVDLRFSVFFTWKSWSHPWKKWEKVPVKEKVPLDFFINSIRESSREKIRHHIPKKMRKKNQNGACGKKK